MKNTFSDSLIRVATDRCTPGHLVLDVRLPWYRTLPLSVVEIADLDLDGASVALGTATLELDGRHHALSALPERTTVQWFVQDSGFLHLELPGFDPTAAHTLSLLVKLYPPYIPMLTWVTRGTTTLEAA